MAAWLAVTGLQARRDLLASREDVHTVQRQLLVSDFAGARTAADAARAHAHAARDRTAGPLWTAVAHLPFLGRPATTIRGVAQAADRLSTQALPAVIDGASVLDPNRLRLTGDTVDLAPISSAAGPLQRAAAVTDDVRRSLGRLPHVGWLPPVAHGRDAAAAALESLGRSLDAAATATRLLSPMLGADGTRRYILVFQNEAEARGTGGLPGAYAILEATHGHLRFTRFGNDTDFGGVHATVDLGPDYHDRYDAGAGPTDVFVNSDISPHFPYAAQIWRSMWEHKTGQHLDGALATDPTALSYLLGATGPTRLADGTRVTAGNVVALTESVAYARYRDTARRKAFFLDIARAVAGDVLHGTGGHARAVVKALGHAAGEGRLLAWSARPEEQAQLATTPLAGIVPDTPAPYAGLVVVNAAGSKLDYYLDRSVTWTAGGCGGKTRTATVTVRLRNDAPTSGLPPYVVVRPDHPAPVTPGNNRLLVSLYATEGAQLTGLTRDGATGFATIERERGHPVFTVDVSLDPQAATTLTFRLLAPTAPGAPLVPVQPLVRPMTVEQKVPTCRA